MNSLINRWIFLVWVFHSRTRIILGKVFEILLREGFLTASVVLWAETAFANLFWLCLSSPAAELGSRFPSGASRALAPEHLECWRSYWPLVCRCVRGVGMAILSVFPSPSGIVIKRRYSIKITHCLPGFSSGFNARVIFSYKHSTESKLIISIQMVCNYLSCLKV